MGGEVMGYIEAKCPSCGKSIRRFQDNIGNQHFEVVCMGCHHRIRVDYNMKTKSVSRKVIR
jgi:RNase P subunit RPR2